MYIFNTKNFTFSPISLKSVYEEAGTWPEGKEVSEETFLKFLGIPPEGKVLGAKNGLPIWVDRPAVSKERLKEVAEQKVSILSKETQSKINVIQYAIELEMATEEETEKLPELKKYMVLLSRVSQQKGYPETIEWPETPQ